jgi:hypothetical protein
VPCFERVQWGTVGAASHRFASCFALEFHRPLGTALESKVIRPFLVSGLQKRDLQKPILVRRMTWINLELGSSIWCSERCSEQHYCCVHLASCTLGLSNLYFETMLHPFALQCIVISDGEPVGEPHGTVKRVIQQVLSGICQIAFPIILGKLCTMYAASVVSQDGCLLPFDTASQPCIFWVTSNAPEYGLCSAPGVCALSLLCSGWWSIGLLHLQAKQAAAQSQYGPGAISFEFAQVGKVHCMLCYMLVDAAVCLNKA